MLTAFAAREDRRLLTMRCIHNEHYSIKHSVPQEQTTLSPLRLEANKVLEVILRRLLQERTSRPNDSTSFRLKKRAVR